MTDTPEHLPSVQVLSARDHLEQAWQLALQWRDDAELKYIKASVIGPEQVGPLYVGFTFESPDENYAKFYVDCSLGRCTGREFSVSRTSGWGAIDFDEQMIDSIEAATIGLQNGGDGYARMGKGTTMWVRLARDKPRTEGLPVWEAYYAATGSPLYVIIDPYTGEVIRVE